PLLASEAGLIGFDWYSAIAAIGKQLTCLDVVCHQRTEHFSNQALLQLRVFYRPYDFHPPAQVPIHPICRPDVNHRLAAVAEVEYTTVLEESVHDGCDADVIAQPGNPGPQRTDAATDDVDLNPRLTGLVQLVHDGRLQETVYLCDDPPLATGSLV